MKGFQIFDASLSKCIRIDKKFTSDNFLKIIWIFLECINFAKPNRGVAQLASVLAWGARGRKFESSHPDKDKSQLLLKQVIAIFYFTFISQWNFIRRKFPSIVDTQPGP